MAKTLRTRLAALSVHNRVIIAVILLTALALIFSGTVVHLWGRLATERRIHTNQQLAVTFLRQLASEADPATGQPWQGPDELLRAALQRTLLAPTEGAFGVINSEVAWTAYAGVPLRPETDAELVAAVMPATLLATVTHARVKTATHDWSYVVIPVDFSAQDATAAFVQVTDMGQERALLAPIYAAYASVGAASLILVALIIWLFVAYLMRPISTVRTTAQEITATDISRRIPVQGHDDLSQLARTVNEMLDRLEAALDGQRQLLDDVGHELRTPLTIARGHLELINAQDPAEVAATRKLVISEMDRMRRLVEDLLTLARSRQPDLLRLEEVDVVELTDLTLSNATRLGERAWRLDQVAEVSAWMDPQRIAQAWLQLAANAVQYSDEGAVIALGSRAGRGEVSLWVRDEGRGIDPLDQEKIFQRTMRADLGEGTGLGLSIVTAIVASHGGRLDLDSTPGQGSTFTMVLPRKEKQ